jgi:hypothetical protein
MRISTTDAPPIFVSASAAIYNLSSNGIGVFGKANYLIRDVWVND